MNDKESAESICACFKSATGNPLIVPAKIAERLRGLGVEGEGDTWFSTTRLSAKGTK